MKENGVGCQTSLRVPPTQHAPGAQRIPTARPTDLLHLEEGFATVLLLHRPSPIITLPLLEEVNRQLEAAWQRTHTVGAYRWPT